MSKVEVSERHLLTLTYRTYVPVFVQTPKRDCVHLETHCGINE